jgi:PAS domain S-box-containing protein
MSDEHTCGFANRAHAAFLKKNPEELAGRRLHDILPKETADSLTRCAVRAFRTGTVCENEEMVPDGEGNRRLLSVRAVPELDSDKKVARVVCQATDITDSRKAESSLRESRERFDQMARQSRTVVWEVDSEGVFTFVSPVVRDVLGYRVDELVGRLHFYDLHPERGREAFRKSSMEVFSRREMFLGRVNIVLTRDGRPIVVSTNGVPLLNADGSLRGYRGSDTDITRHHTAEKALRENEALYRSTIDALECSLHIIDSEFRIVMMNRTFREWCERLGINTEAVGLNLREQFPFLDDSVIGEYIGVMESGEPLVTCEDTELNGTVFSTETRKTPISFDDGNPGVLTTITDITQLKRAQQAHETFRGRYEQLVEMISDIIWIYETDARGRFRSGTISPAADRLLGLPPGTINHSFDTFFSHVHPQDLPALLSTLRMGIQARRESGAQDYRVIRADGETLWFRSHASTHSLTDGGIAVYGITTDITEQMTAERILRDSEEKHRLLFVHAISAILMYEQVSDGSGRPRDYKVIDANPAFERVTGMKAVDVVGRRITEVFPGVENTQFFTIFGKMARTGIPVNFSHYMEPLGKHLQINAYSLGNGRLASMFTDITEEIRAQEAIRAGEARYQEVVSSISDIIWSYEVDEKGQVIKSYMSPAAGRILGLDREISFQEYFSHIHPEDHKRVTEHFERAIKTCEQNAETEFRVCPVNGGVAWMRVRGSANPQPDGHILASGTGMEITREKLAGQALNEREEMYRALVEGLPDYVVRFDSQGRHLFVSRNVCELMGMDQSQIIGRTYRELGVPEDRCRFWEENLRMVFEGQQTIEMERVFTERGTSVVHSIRFVPERSGDGTVKSVLAIGQDVTRRIRDAEAREKLQSRLGQVQKMESIGRLAGGVAHDFNNMLGVILGYASTALDQLPTDHPLRFQLEEIRKAGERSAELTRQLLAFARQQVIQPGVVDLNRSMESLSKMLRRLMGAAIELVCLPGEDLWPVMVDPSQVDQILVNLCVNARDAIGGGSGTVTIETRNIVADESYSAWHPGFPPGDFVMLAVSDDGCGMDRDTIDKLFEPFFTTKEAGSGTGLGLATGYGIVRQNNGFINVYSEPGQGTTFKVYLPRYTGEEKPTQERVEHPVRGGTETILITEDEPSIRQLTTAMLESLGYSVTAADTPIQAIALADTAKKHFDLLITDVVMPGMNGRELAAAITEKSPKTRVLYVSGYTADVLARREETEPAGGFLQKPFSKFDLAEAVRSVLDR